MTRESAKTASKLTSLVAKNDAESGWFYTPFYTHGNQMHGHEILGTSKINIPAISASMGSIVLFIFMVITS